MVAKGDFTRRKAQNKLSMFFAYVLLSRADQNLYIGFSSNLEKRLDDHNNGRVRATKRRRPLELIYYEAYLNKKDAEGREKFLKSGSGHRFLKKQLKNTLLKISLGM